MLSARSTKPLPSIFVHKEVVNERINNYLNTKHSLLSANLGRNDTKSAWYSLQQFEELMREIYYQNADGVRIYFGAYSNTDLEYPNQLTIIFVPTYFNESTNKNTDIIIDDDEDFGVRAAIEENTSLFSKITKGLDTAGLCPPSCEDQDFGFPL